MRANTWGAPRSKRLEAARALLDASLRASGLHSVAPDSLASEIGRSLDALVSSLRKGEPFALPPSLTDPLTQALGAEIERWQARSQTDADARPVLRAFLGITRTPLGVGRAVANRTRVAPCARSRELIHSPAS